MAQRQFPKGTQGGSGSGGASGRYIEHSRIREVTCDRTTEAEMRARAQRAQNQAASLPPKPDANRKP
jgi:hypothetical protein